MPARRGLRCLERRCEFIGIPKPAVVHLTSFGIWGWLWTILPLRCSSGPWQIYQKPLLRGARPLGKPRFALSWSCACDAGSERGPHMCGYLRFSDKGPTIASSPASTHQQRHCSTQLNAQWQSSLSRHSPGIGGFWRGSGQGRCDTGEKRAGKQVCGRDISKVLAPFFPSNRGTPPSMMQHSASTPPTTS